MICPQCGASVSDDALFCRECGAPIEHENKPRMIWYSILVYGLLYFSAVLNLLIGVCYIFGVWYMVLDSAPSVSNAAVVYGEFPALRIADIAYGLGGMALGGMQLFTRYLLRRYKKSAPAAVAAVYGAAALLPAAYYVVSNLIVDSFDAVSIAIRVLSFAGAAAMFVFNVIYFRKRRGKFTN